jgi:predicted DNA-binding transcriptional regulator YafY
MTNNSITQLERQWQILTILPMASSQPKSTGEIHLELSEKLGTSIPRRTVERDLESLAERFDLQRTTAGKSNYWSWEDVPVMWLPGLDKEQALALFMVRQNLIGLLPEATIHSLEPFFRAAEDKLSSTPCGVRSWKQKFRLIESRQMLCAPEINEQALRLVRHALLYDEPINVTWRNRAGDKEHRHCILPLAITQRGAELYLIYRNLDDAHDGFVPMQRIQSAHPSLADRPAQTLFDIDAYLESGQLGFGKQYPIRVGQTIRLEAAFSRKTADRLRETPLVNDQVLKDRPDGRVGLRASVKFSGQLLWWLLSYGASVEVIGPALLRSLVAETLKNAAEQYSRDSHE